MRRLLICLDQRENVGYPWGSIRDICQHIPPIHGFYSGCIGQYGLIFWEQLLGYHPKGTQIFHLIGRGIFSMV